MRMLCSGLHRFRPYGSASFTQHTTASATVQPTIEPVNQRPWRQYGSSHTDTEAKSKTFSGSGPTVKVLRFKSVNGYSTTDEILSRKVDENWKRFKWMTKTYTGTQMVHASIGQQATSNKQQATSNKQQATSNKQQATDVSVCAKQHAATTVTSTPRVYLWYFPDVELLGGLLELLAHTAVPCIFGTQDLLLREERQALLQSQLLLVGSDFLVERLIFMEHLQPSMVC
jgi:hypothetical protein